MLSTLRLAFPLYTHTRLHLVTLPRGQVSVELSKEDAANYAILERQSQALVQAQAAAGSLMQNLTHVLAVLMRLRQVSGAHHTLLRCRDMAWQRVMFHRPY